MPDSPNKTVPIAIIWCKLSFSLNKFIDNDPEMKPMALHKNKFEYYV
jgi:hypothetical protein